MKEKLGKNWKGPEFLQNSKTQLFRKEQLYEFINFNIAIA